LDVFRSLLDQIAHEDNLLIGRIWLLAGNFLLLLVYFPIDANKPAPRPAINHSRLIGMGILSTIFIYSAILASEFEFVSLRIRMLALTTEHADLPMRTLPSVGIGADLLCPILLGLLVLYVWVRADNWQWMGRRIDRCVRIAFRSFPHWRGAPAHDGERGRADH
jgi:hypothetical protein